MGLAGTPLAKGATVDGNPSTQRGDPCAQPTSLLDGLDGPDGDGSGDDDASSRQASAQSMAMGFDWV